MQSTGDLGSAHVVKIMSIIFSHLKTSTVESIVDILVDVVLNKFQSFFFFLHIMYDVLKLIFAFPD